MDPLTHEKLCMENELNVSKFMDPLTNEQLSLENELKIGKLYNNHYCGLYTVRHKLNIYFIVS